MSRNKDYTIGNLLDSLYYRHIGMELSRQPVFLSKLNFVGNLEDSDGATMFFIAEKGQKTILNFSWDYLIVTE